VETTILVGKMPWRRHGRTKVAGADEVEKVVATGEFVAMCLLAGSPAVLDRVLVHDEAYREAVAGGLHPVGKTFRASNGYIQIGAESGRWMPELPEGVRPEDVISLPVKDREATPGEDALRAVIDRLRGLADPRAEAAVQRFEQSFEACGFAYNALTFLEARVELKRQPRPRSTTPDACERYSMIVLTALRMGAANTLELRGLLAADAVMTSEALLAHRLALGLASKLPTPIQRGPALGRFVSALLGMPTPWDYPSDAIALSDHLVSEGHVDVLQAVAEDLDRTGRDLVQQALGAPDMIEFHRQLFSAMVPIRAVLGIASRLRYLNDASVDRDYWAALAGNAEERAVRIGWSFAAALRDGGTGMQFELHRRHVESIRASSSDKAARREARNYIEAHLHYPRAMLPLLLSATAEPT
jgi:hypothetical protein